jgi:carboxypeptidase PM20D1
MARAKPELIGMPVKLDWIMPPRDPSKISSTSLLRLNYVSTAAHPAVPHTAIAPISSSRAKQPQF